MGKARFTIEPEKPAEQTAEEPKPVEEKENNDATPTQENPQEPQPEERPQGQEEGVDEENDGGDNEEVLSAEQALALPEQASAVSLPELPPKEIVEAALFIANKPLHKKDIAKNTGLDVKKVEDAIIHLSNDYSLRPGALEIAYDGEQASMHVKGSHVQRVSALSKQIDLSRKALRILALVSKKKGMLQSDLRLYFKGEIYDYITELKERGYLHSERYKNTRLLKPTKKFYESFQLA